MERSYSCCARCGLPMENAILKTVNTETWLLQFGICVVCHEEILAEKDPSIIAKVGGKLLKKLIKSNKTLFEGTIRWKLEE